MPKIETPEEFAVRYEQCMFYSSHNLASMVTARDAAIRAESAELLRVCGEALKATQSIAPEFSILGAVRAKSALDALKDAGVWV